MITRVLVVLAILLSAATQCFASESGHTNCSGLVGGGATVTSISGDVTVPDGQICTLSFVNIKGNVKVGRDATLIISAYTEPSTLGGNVEANNCNSVLLQGSVTVRGNLNINSCNGTGQNGFQGPDVVINGNFECQSNAGPCLAWLGTVQPPLHVQSNRSQVASDISLVSVRGNLHCQSNSPAPTHLHGPSWVSGQSSATKHAGFETTATSIATPDNAEKVHRSRELPGFGFSSS